MAYSPIMPQPIAGMGATATQAAYQQPYQPPAQMGLFQATEEGQVFNSATGAMQNPGFFGKGGMAQMGIGAIGTLGSLWNSFQQNKLAKKSIDLQERTFETNLYNQTKTYNTELEDRIRTRYDTERRDPKEADTYIAKNRL